MLVLYIADIMPIGTLKKFQIFASSPKRGVPVFINLTIYKDRAGIMSEKIIDYRDASRLIVRS